MNRTFSMSYRNINDLKTKIFIKKFCNFITKQILVILSILNDQTEEVCNSIHIQALVILIKKKMLSI